MKALIVDDNLLNLKVAARLIEQAGLEVETVMSGYECIARVKDIIYDVIFMDIMMPEMDGVETFKKLRESGVNIPIIALTADAEAGAKEKYLDVGFDDYISKPIMMNELERVLDKYRK